MTNIQSITKDKLLSIRIEKDIYQLYVDKALKKGNKEKRVVKLSEVLRDAIVAYLDK